MKTYFCDLFNQMWSLVCDYLLHKETPKTFFSRLDKLTQKLDISNFAFLPANTKINQSDKWWGSRAHNYN